MLFPSLSPHGVDKIRLREEDNLLVDVDVVVSVSEEKGVKMAVGVKPKRLFMRRGPPETRRWRPRLSKTRSSSILFVVREGEW